jgi:hypothetical protein
MTPRPDPRDVLAILFLGATTVAALALAAALEGSWTVLP